LLIIYICVYYIDYAELKIKNYYKLYYLEQLKIMSHITDYIIIAHFTLKIILRD